MTEQTIRDVVIRVSIENGNMKLGEPDISAFKSKISELKAQATRTGGSALAAEAEKATRAYQSASSAAVASAASFAKGLALVAASGDEQTQSMMRTIVQIEGYIDIVSGGIQSLNNFHEVLRQGAKLRTAGGAAQAGGQAVASGASTVATAGKVAKTAGGLANGAVAVSATAVIASLGAIAAGLIALKVVEDETREINKHYWAELAEDAERATTRMTAAMVRHSEQATHLARSMPNISATMQTIPNIERREKVEAANRAMEARTDLTPEQKSERRRTREQETGHQEAADSAVTDFQDKQKRIAELKRGDEQRNSEKANLKGTFRNRRNSIRDEMRQTVYGDDTAYNRMANFVSLGFTGQMNKNSETTRKQNLNTELMKVDVDEASATLSANKALEASKREQLQLNQQSVQALQKQYDATKATQQSAYASVQSSKDKIKSDKMQFGSLSYGQQERVLELQRKHQRIQKQRSDNVAAGRPEFFGVEEYTHEEKKIGTSVAGVQNKSIQEQNLRDAKNRGFKSEEEEFLPEKEKRLEEANAMQPRAEELKKKIAEMSQSTEGLANELVDAMKDVFVTQDFVASVKSALEEMKASNQSDQFLRSTFTGSQ